MTHDPESLASAYLDGELTDDERRIAEADPALMAEVDELRTLRARLVDVEPAGDATRESAIGAAMAAFHEQFTAEQPEAVVGAAHAAGDEDRDATVVPLFRRFASPQWLGVAAAAVVLVVAVGVVSTRGADDEGNSDMATANVESDAGDDGADDASAEEPADEAARIAESEVAGDVFATQADEPTSDEPMSEEPAEQSTEMAAAEPTDGDDDTADMAGGNDDGLDTSGMIPALDDPAVHFDDDVPLLSPLQLRSAALYLLAQREAGTLGPTPEYRCDFFNVLGAAQYGVEGDLGDLRDVLIDIDEDARIAVAVDRDDCAVIAMIPLDEP